MRCIVYGYGSVGSRHAKILSELGHEVACVTTRDCGNLKKYHILRKAFVDFDPELCVIANCTVCHIPVLRELEK